MPTREFSPIVQPCRIALWPMVQPAPMLKGAPYIRVEQSPSWILVASPISISSLSPRSTRAEPDPHIPAEPHPADDMGIRSDPEAVRLGQDGRNVVEAIDRHGEPGMEKQQSL